MSHPPKPQSPPSAADPLSTLTALGFGPDTVLMNDPKLFVDGRFLASLLVELEDELGSRHAGLALFQIGLLHGLRDAARCCRHHGEEDANPTRAAAAETTALVMTSPSGLRIHHGGELALAGSWPECHEAAARISRLDLAPAPACSLSAGYTSGWLSGILDRSLVAREVECAAAGGSRCRFEVIEAPAEVEKSDPELAWLLAQVPFDAFRKIALRPPIERRERPAPGAPIGGDGRFDRTQPVVHIWGPVMVLPFTTLEEALGTVDLLGRDPGISEIRSVVVDLRERPLDEGFGAAALEQVLETIESWNAQGLITGISPGSEAAIASLESSHLILRKDLAEAIATAFQIADAQRHTL
ncbi:4-vinyl reductase [Myxococcota bacterium]|nr:4-vinyl reductase [Myxococcota bacterium]